MSFAGLLPNDSVHTFSSSVPILKAIARKFIMNYVRRGKDRNFSLKSKRFAAVTARGFVPFGGKRYPKPSACRFRGIGVRLR